MRNRTKPVVARLGRRTPPRYRSRSVRRPASARGQYCGAVILLDTNQVHDRSPDGPFVRMLQKIAQQTGHDLVLPEMVSEEHLARYRHEVESATVQVEKAERALHRLVPSWPVETPSADIVIKEAVDARKAQLERIFRIHPTPEGAHREALQREANRRRPAKTSWDAAGAGARDVVIWLTALDACRTGRTETYFVTENSTDFGKDGSLWPELAHDLDQHLGQDVGLFHYCPNIADLMTQLAVDRVQGPDSDSISGAASVRAAVEVALTDGEAFMELASAIPNLTYKFVGAFEGVRDIRLDRLQGPVEAYRIGDTVWACGRGRWAGWKDFTVVWKPEFAPLARNRGVQVDFTVTATVVMQLDQSGVIVDAEVTDRSRLSVAERLMSA